MPMKLIPTTRPLSFQCRAHVSGAAVEWRNEEYGLTVVVAGDARRLHVDGIEGEFASAAEANVAIARRIN